MKSLANRKYFPKFGKCRIWSFLTLLKVEMVDNPDVLGVQLIVTETKSFANHPWKVSQGAVWIS